MSLRSAQAVVSGFNRMKLDVGWHRFSEGALGIWNRGMFGGAGNQELASGTLTASELAGVEAKKIR